MDTAVVSKLSQVRLMISFIVDGFKIDGLTC